MTPVLLTIAALLMLGYGLHRLALWADDRGWLYYRKESRAKGAQIGVMTVMSIFHPQAMETIDEIWEERAQIEQDESGES